MYTLLQMLNDADMTIENAIAEDLMAQGYSEEDARKQAEKIGDEAMHTWIEKGNLLASTMAKMWHAYELHMEQRKCLSDRHKDLRPSAGKDNRQGDKTRMVPNDTFHRGSPSQADCEWVDTAEYVYDEEGNIIGVTVSGHWVCSEIAFLKKPQPPTGALKWAS
jgi:hypothetical protein